MVKAHMCRDKNKPFKTHTKNKFKICKIRLSLIKLAKVRDTLANLLENGFDTVERLRCIEASTPVRAIAKAENSIPQRLEDVDPMCIDVPLAVVELSHATTSS